MHVVRTAKHLPVRGYWYQLFFPSVHFRRRRDWLQLYPKTSFKCSDSSIFGDDSDDFVNLRVLLILATLIFVVVKRHFRRQMTSHSLVSGRNSSTFGDASNDFVNLRVLLDSSYAHFRRRKTCYRTIDVHFRGQTNSHSLVSGRNSSTFGDASNDFVNLRVLLDSSYAHFRRRKTCYRTIDVHFRGQTNSHSLVSGRNSSTFGDASDDFVNLRVLLDSSYAHFRRRKTC